MSIATITATSRQLVRDFPKYFEVELGPLNILTIRLPHPLIQSTSLQVYVASQPPISGNSWTTTLTTAWELDDRNGLLKLTDASALGQRVLISGYHYTWFADSDLALASAMSAEETLYNTTGDTDDIEGIYTEVTAMGAVVRALWSLALELSLDIDVSTPEGMYIPARQRYSQVMQMMQYWENEYTTRATALNIGLNQIEQFNMRRIAYLTNRYVPMYKAREVDDHRWPQRIYPPIPDGTMSGPTHTELDVVEAVADAEPGDLANRAVTGPTGRWYGGQDIGWTSIGTRGDTEYLEGR
jgi:hypothetical protein